eukprot:299998_1
MMVSYQHIMYFPVTAVSRFNMYFQAWKLVMNPSLKVESRGPEIVCLSVYAIWFIALLLCLPDFLTMVLFVLISHAVCGMVHVQITLSHFPMPCHFGDGFESADGGSWVKMQLETCLDVDCAVSMDWFHGGLQYQSVHHLFPKVPRHKLRHVRDKYFLPLLQRHNLTYNILPFFECIRFVFSRMKEEALMARKYPNRQIECNYLLNLLMCRG